MSECITGGEPSPSGQDKLAGVQVARALAALSVAYFHSYIALRIYPESAQYPIAILKDWGYLGVNFFFAISGYVICLVAEKKNFTVRSFVVKRLFRLYPMYWTAMAAIAFMILIGRYPAQSVGHFLYSMTLLPQQGAPAYDVSWTLERELVFYAIAVVTVPLTGIHGLAAVLGGLAFSGWYFGNPWSFHLVSTHQGDFLGGVLVFLIHRKFKLDLALSVAAILSGSFLLWFTRSHDFAFAAPLSLAIVLLGMVNLKLPWEHWSLRWLVGLGDASYSLYLWHYIAFAISFIMSFKITTHPDWMCEPWRFSAIALCCWFSCLTWRKIEKPFIALADRISRVRSNNPDDAIADDDRRYDPKAGASSTLCRAREDAAIG
jgi:exopolysaccharide production protein ExoZ